MNNNSSLVYELNRQDTPGFLVSNKLPYNKSGSSIGNAQSHNPYDGYFPVKERGVSFSNKR
jgi:hypothetical protein